MSKYLNCIYIIAFNLRNEPQHETVHGPTQIEPPSPNNTRIYDMLIGLMGRELDTVMHYITLENIYICFLQLNFLGAITCDKGIVGKKIGTYEQTKPIKEKTDGSKPTVS